MRILQYVWSCGLIIIYCFTFVKCFDYSNVTDEYKGYYIEHNYKYLLHKDELRKYGVNKRIVYDRKNFSRNLGKGWSNNEKEAIWAIRNSSDFYIWIDNVRPNYILIIELAGTMGYDNILRVGSYQFSLGRSDKNFQIIVPGKVLREGVNKFTISTSDDVKRYCDKNLSSSDLRRLNVCLHSIELREI